MSNIIHIKAGKIVGIKTSIFTIFNQEKYDAKAIPAAWQEFFSKARELGLADAQIFYGASIPSMSLDAPMDYLAGALVAHDVDVPSGFESVDLPEGDYLAHIHKGPITDIDKSYRAAYMDSLPASGKEMRPAPHLEIYNAMSNPMAEDYEMTIAVPIN